MVLGEREEVDRESEELRKRKRKREKYEQGEPRKSSKERVRGGFEGHGHRKLKNKI